MIRVRFHGRGGHGVKTASRVVGTAAFLAGYQSQDSPVYGAERRGAAVTAFARISREPILERGMIEHPDLIIVADETLLNDAAAGVLSSQQTASAVFVNTISDESQMSEYGITTKVITCDLNGHSLRLLGRASALSAGLGAAAARMVGIISEAQMLEALREELEHLGVPEDDIDKNVLVAREVFAAVPEVAFEPGQIPAAASAARIEYDGPLVGTPSVLNAGNSVLRHTGAWRVERPVIDRDVCTRCGLCFAECPDAAISLDEDGFPVIDYDHCKGCMICREICPLEGIHTEKETQAW